MSLPSDLLFPSTSTSEESEGGGDRYPPLHGLNAITTWMPENLRGPNEPLFPSRKLEWQIN